MPLTQDPELERLPPIDVSPGVILHCFNDPKKPEGSRDKYWTEVEWTGEAGKTPFEVPRHWHKHHDEWWEVLEGRIDVYSGGEKFIMSAGDATKTSPRKTVHGLKAFPGERMVLRESTMPSGPFKEAFFRDMFYHGQPGFLYLMRNFLDGDTYPHMGLKFLWIDELFINLFGNLARLFVPGSQVGSTTAAAVIQPRKDL